MGDLISRSSLIGTIWDKYNSRYNNASIFEPDETELINKVLCEIQTLTEEQPTVEAMPVVHGEWEYKQETINTYEGWLCSQCKEFFPYPYMNVYRFCPNCGADMRKKVK